MPFGYNAAAMGGQLPWGAAPPPPTSAAGLTANYQQNYQNALGMNQSNYQNILQGYQNTIASQNAGYSSLYSDVMGTISGIERGRADAINADSRAFMGGQTQSLIDRGLGNTTVQSAVASGVEADRARRMNELSGQMAGIRGQYQSQLGLAQLGAVGGLQSRQLDWMNSVSAAYPDAGMYGQMALQYGATDAARRAAEQIGAAGDAAASGGGAGAGMPAPRVGYTPQPRLGGVPAGAQGGANTFFQIPGGAVGAGSAMGGIGGALGAGAYGGNAIGMIGGEVPAAGYGNALGMTSGFMGGADLYNQSANPWVTGGAPAEYRGAGQGMALNSMFG
jgi:hypothetical protein